MHRCNFNLLAQERYSGDGQRLQMTSSELVGFVFLLQKGKDFDLFYFVTSFNFRPSQTIKHKILQKSLTLYANKWKVIVVDN